jgi:hypothetical protein
MMTATFQRPLARQSTVVAPEPPDDLVVFTIRSIALFPAVRDLAWHLGSELFEDEAARVLVSWLLTGAIPTDPGPRLCARLGLLLREALLTTVPSADDPEWGVHLLALLAEREHRPLLAATLRWAASGVEEGLPLRYLKRRVHEAFAVAEGKRPVDAALVRGGRGEWRS